VALRKWRPRLEEIVEQQEQDKPAAAAGARPINRREFLRGVSKRAVYVAPLIATLTASQAQAKPSPSCVPSGEHCSQDSDCCSLNCADGAMQCAAN
jgi:hypothetical protein